MGFLVLPVSPETEGTVDPGDEGESQGLPSPGSQENLGQGPGCQPTRRWGEGWAPRLTTSPARPGL